MNKPNMIILVVAFLIATASPTFACVCAETSFEDTFQEVKAVFSGKVVKAEYKKGIVNELQELEAEQTGKKIEYEVLVLTFEVERWWKGGTSLEVTLVADQTRDANGKVGISTCEFEYIVGERYLIFAWGEKDRLLSGACTPTNKLEKAEKELKLLGEGKEPERQRKPSK